MTMQQTSLSRGNEALRNKDYKAAIRHYNRALAQNPELAAMLQNNIDLAYKRGGIPKPATGAVTTETVDIVVPVYNALEDVKKCLESLQRCTDGLSVKVIVVNDGSDDTTTQWLRDYCSGRPVFKLIEHETNAGYTKAVNTGLKATTADYVITQNSDTIVSPGWLTGLIQCMNSSPTIGIVGPLSNAASWQNVPNLRDENGKFAINDLPEDFTVEKMANIVQRCSSKTYPKVPFINGFCFMIKREVINTIGHMDEENFPVGYGEENDYCIRALDEGFELAIADDVYVFHAKSKSFGHSRRTELAKAGDVALRRKHTELKFNNLVKLISKNNALSEIRQSIKKSISDNSQFIPSTKTSFRSILFVLPVGAGGGGAHSVIQEAAGLRKLGINSNVAVMQLNRNAFLAAYSDIDDIQNLLIGYHTSKNRDEQFKNLSFAKDYQIIVATLYSTVSLVKLITQRIPTCLPAYYVQDYEPYFFAEGSEQWKIADRSYSLIENATLFAKTQWIIDKVKEMHGLTVHKVEPSIDHDVYRPLVRKYSQKLVISAMIRPSSQRRGADRTMRVLKRVYQEFQHTCSIRIFGCRSDDPQFLKLENDFEHHNSGILTRPQVATVLGLSDIFIDLSDYQAFGRTALEAMACGATVVVPESGGAHEYARDNINSIVVDTSNEDLVFDRISEMLKDVRKLAEMKRAALLTASRYSIQSAVTSEFLLFSKILTKICESPSVDEPNFKRDLLIMPGLMADGNPAGSGYVRLLLPYSSSVLTGWHVRSWLHRELPPIGSADAIFIQREMGGIDLEYFEKWALDWKTAGGKIFYDIDDNLLDAHELSIRINSTLAVAEKRTQRIKVLAGHADVVTVSMPSLIELLEPLSKSVRLVPNFIDEATWWISKPKPSGPDCHTKDSGEVIRIGYIGTPTHNQDLEVIAEAIALIEAEFGSRISIETIGGFQSSNNLFGNPIGLPKKTEYPYFVEWLGKRVNWDIGLIPLLDDNFNKSKSYLKFLEYSALNLAIVCSDVSTYTFIAKHDHNCLVAKNSTTEWYRAIKRLIIDKQLRERLAKQSNSDVRDGHTIQKNAHLFSDVLSIR